jgi:hypothetical protein
MMAYQTFLNPPESPFAKGGLSHESNIFEIGMNLCGQFLP